MSILLKRCAIFVEFAFVVVSCAFASQSADISKTEKVAKYREALAKQLESHRTLPDLPKPGVSKKTEKAGEEVEKEKKVETFRPAEPATLQKPPVTEPSTDIAKKPGFSFKKFLGFGTSDSKKQQFPTTTEQPTKAPAKTEAPSVPKSKVEVLPERTREVATDVAGISKDSYQKFASLGGSVTPKDLSETEKKSLVEIGDKLLSMTKEDLDALNPEDKLKVFTILKARTVQFQMGENLAANIDEAKSGVRKTIASLEKQIEEAKQKGATEAQLKPLKDQLARNQEGFNQKNKDLAALEDAYGFKFARVGGLTLTTEQKSKDAALKAEHEKYKTALNASSKSMGSEVDLRVDIVKSQQAEIAKMIGQKKPLTADQVKLRDSYCQNLVALHSLAEESKGSEEKKTASRAKLDEPGAAAKFGDIATGEGERKLAEAKKDLERDIQEGKKQISQVQSVLAESSKTLKALAPSFVRSQRAQIKDLNETINKQKAEMEKALKDNIPVMKQLGTVKDSVDAEKQQIADEIGMRQRKIKDGEPYTVERDGEKVTEYRALTGEEKAKFQREIAEKNERFKALTDVARQVDETSKRYTDDQKAQSEKLAALQKTRDGIAQSVETVRTILITKFPTK